ncbi:alpha/beta fold hydrolase [Streptomyces cinnamoneus]|uniref:alpha/beta fold hydrolase n=1 Tax=Streptomyces cinnamoneus TaxID=53446 RepID=UPI003793D307
MAEDLQITHGSIRYSLRGDGPPLVLLSTLAGTWMRQATTLSKDFTVLTYDMRGFGESPSETGFPDNEGHADDLAEILDKLGFPRAHLFGLSQGGMVSQYFARRHPDRLEKLGLIATHAKATNQTRLFLEMLTGFLERDDLANFWEVLKAFLFSPEHSSAVLRREEALKQAVFNRYTAKSLHNIYDQVLEHDSTSWLKEISCPTVVVAGRDDLLYGPPIATEISTRVPGARLELLPAAHVPPVEVPELFNRLVLGFCRESQ